MNSRFYFPDRFTRLMDRETLLMFFTFVDNDTGLEYSNWRLLSGSNGHFVASPSEAFDHPQKGMQYYPYVRAAYDAQAESKRSAKGDAFMTALTQAAYEQYEKMKGNTVTPGAPQSGRGPVTAPAEDDGLPF